MRKHKKRIPIFYTVYFSLILLFVFALMTSVRIVHAYLADYESAQPQHEAQRVFERYYATGDYAALIEAVKPNVTPFESSDAVRKHLLEMTSGKEITYAGITTGLDLERKYIVKADDIKFSSFVLEESVRTTPKGFPLYECTSLDIYTAGTESVNIIAPLGYTVYLNDKPLNTSYLTGKQTEDISCKHMPSGVSGVIFAEYKVDGLYYLPESVRILALNGKECPVEQSGEGFYSTGILYDEELASVYSEYVTKAAQAIAAYMQNDGKFSTVSPYIDSESELFVNLKTAETYFVVDHSSYSFEDVRTSEFCRYDENTFSCRVSFTHVLKRTGSKDYKDYIDTTFFLRRSGDKFLIYDRYNH